MSVLKRLFGKAGVSAEIPKAIELPHIHRATGSKTLEEERDSIKAPEAGVSAETPEAKELPHIHRATGSKTLEEEWASFKVPVFDQAVDKEYKAFLGRQEANTLETKQRLCALGWWDSARADKEFSADDLKRIFYITFYNISLRDEYHYHGTSTASYNSVCEHGLDNSKGSVAHRGVMQAGKQNVAYANDFSLCRSYAEKTAEQDGAESIVYRWKHHSIKSADFLKNTVGMTDTPVSASVLEFCLDGKGHIWYPCTLDYMKPFFKSTQAKEIKETRAKLVKEEKEKAFLEKLRLRSLRTQERILKDIAFPEFRDTDYKEELGFKNVNGLDIPKILIKGREQIFLQELSLKNVKCQIDTLEKDIGFLRDFVKETDGLKSSDFFIKNEADTIGKKEYIEYLKKHQKRLFDNAFAYLYPGDPRYIAYGEVEKDYKNSPQQKTESSQSRDKGAQTQKSAERGTDSVSQSENLNGMFAQSNSSNTRLDDKSRMSHSNPVPSHFQSGTST